MRYILFALLAILALSLVSCGASSRVPESSLTLRNATTNALISTSKTTGGITIDVAEEYPIMVIRSYKDENGQTFNEDVTQFANWKWISGAGAASVDAFGNLTGLAEGNAQLEVKFRESSLEPWDIVRLDIAVIVPAP